MTPRSPLTLTLFAGSIACSLAGPLSSPAAAQVNVAIDMLPGLPGIQTEAWMWSHSETFDIDVYVWSSTPGLSVWGIGFLGGLDRGVAIGHVPSATNLGRVIGLEEVRVSPIATGATGVLSSGIEKVFAGPELQYIETGAPGPVPIPTQPTRLFTVRVRCAGIDHGDVFNFYLADAVYISRNGTPGFPLSGAFSTTGPVSLDTGGDAVPDSTPTLAGVDADAPAIPVPPAAFLVDYLDGPRGGARLLVGDCYADCDLSTGTPRLTPADFVCFLARYRAGHPYCNCDASTGTPALTPSDFVCFLSRFRRGC